ncbi:MAG: DUF3426 domain-containing protein [Xanthomonadaceae bacterium]|jgi:hypothetical protein|nr:DUF3426 domain-containing protein [Xanthomonadaceae bacterium]
MTLLCPNCLHPIAPDPLTGAAPAVCPDCGWDRERFRRNVRRAFPELTPMTPAVANAGPANPPEPAVTQVSQAAAPVAEAHESMSARLQHSPMPATEAEEAAFIDALFSEESPLAQANEPEAAFVESEARKPSPVAMRRPVAPAPVPRWLWTALPVLALTLGLQILLADRARWAGNTAWRPWLNAVCGILQCSLPPWREPAAFTMLDRGVAAAADQQHVLKIHASFRNDARWAQPWPNLELSLSDADGRLVGRRTFTPAEYRSDIAGKELAPGETGEISFLIREPSSEVIAFSFVFR